MPTWKVYVVGGVIGAVLSAAGLDARKNPLRFIVLNALIIGTVWWATR